MARPTVLLPLPPLPLLLLLLLLLASAWSEAKPQTLQSRVAALESLLLQTQTASVEPRDCSDLSWEGYDVQPLHPSQNPLHPPTPGVCDMLTDGGGWTVIQRRGDIFPRQDFFQDWETYKRGFGDLDGEFWWGLEKLYQLTSQSDRRYQLLVELEDFEGQQRYALYNNFRISSEADGYRLHVDSYSGNAGDSLASGHSGMKFSTKDRDNDPVIGNCAERFEGGWWFNRCHDSNLNGKYYFNAPTQHYPYPGLGLIWVTFRGNRYPLFRTEMKIRPF